MLIANYKDIQLKKQTTWDMSHNMMLVFIVF